MALFFLISNKPLLIIKTICMKKLLLPLISFTLLLTACNTKKSNLDTENRIVFTDTAALNNANASSDVGTKDTTPIVVANKIAEPKVQVKTITKVVKVYEKQRAPKVVEVQTPPVVTTAPVTTPAPGTTTNSGNGNGTGTTGDGTVPAETKKKNTGWSQAAKTATIGGVGGAVIGGVIGKGAKGAAIGGVIGAAGGYILGRRADRKSGRVDTSRN